MKQCHWYKIARTQRQTELSRGQGESGTMYFLEAGCYDCNGFNRNCKRYWHTKASFPESRLTIKDGWEGEW